MTSALVLTAVEAEANAVLAGLSATGGAVAIQAEIGPYRACRVPGEPAVTLLAAGIGPAAAAAAAAAALALEPGVDMVCSVGIAGGFAAAGVRVGDVVLAASSMFADLGADSPAGFRSASELGWDEARYPIRPELVARLGQHLGRVRLRVHTGTVLTVSTVTGTARRAAELSALHRPVAEAMEGAAVATAANRFGRPFAEIRTVSNLVGDRDRAAWDVTGALATLATAMAAALPALGDPAGNPAGSR